MDHFVGLDVSQEITHLCVIGGQGKTVWQAMPFDARCNCQKGQVEGAINRNQWSQSVGARRPPAHC